MHKIKAIIFDFGGVIELSDGGLMEHLASILDTPLERVRNEYFKHNHLSNVQDMRWEDMFAKVAEALGADEKKQNRIKRFLQEHMASRRMNKELLGWLPGIKRQGFKIGILSNATSKLREALEERGVLKLVDELAISAEIGFQKPAPEAFEAIFKKLDVRPEEAVFIDDTPKSLERAGEIGYQPLLFRDNVQLKADLEKLGVNFG